MVKLKRRLYIYFLLTNIVCIIVGFSQNKSTVPTYSGFEFLQKHVLLYFQYVKQLNYTSRDASSDGFLGKSDLLYVYPWNDYMSKSENITHKSSRAFANSINIHEIYGGKIRVVFIPRSRNYDADKKELFLWDLYFIEFFSGQWSGNYEREFASYMDVSPYFKFEFFPFKIHLSCNLPLDNDKARTYDVLNKPINIVCEFSLYDKWVTSERGEPTFTPVCKITSVLAQTSGNNVFYEWHRKP
jgi:hypothetical protein